VAFEMNCGRIPVSSFDDVTNERDFISRLPNVFCTAAERRGWRHGRSDAAGNSSMGRQTLRRHLEWAERQAAQATKFVAKHRLIVARLERERLVAADAKRPPAELELCLEVHMAESNKLKIELGE